MIILILQPNLLFVVLVVHWCRINYLKTQWFKKATFIMSASSCQGSGVGQPGALLQGLSQGWDQGVGCSSSHLTVHLGKEPLSSTQILVSCWLKVPVFPCHTDFPDMAARFRESKTRQQEKENYQKDRRPSQLWQQPCNGVSDFSSQVRCDLVNRQHDEGGSFLGEKKKNYFVKSWKCFQSEF